jgi:hypothetical protein
VKNLAPGAYTVLAVARDNGGGSRLFSEKFEVLAKLLVNVQGKGAVTPGLNGTYLEVGKTYKIKATPKPGQIFAFWSGAVADVSLAATSFLVSSNMELTAHFTNNPFVSLTGTYSGLFLNPENPAPTNSGFVTLTVSGSGFFTGRLMFPSHIYPMIDQFSYDGGAELLGKGFDSNTLGVVFTMDLTGGSDSIVGSVSDLTSSGELLWSSDLTLYRSVNSLAGSNDPAAGKYSLLFQSEGAAVLPAVDGYAAVAIGRDGVVTLNGALPDNSAIFQTSGISKDGIWPVYAVPSGDAGRGMLIGWQTNTVSGLCDGQVFWFNPAFGYATNLISTGAAYSPPKAGTQYQIVLAGGVTNALAVSQNGQFAATPPNLQISLQPGGVLAGFVDVENTKLPCKGIFINPASGGGGFIIGSKGGSNGFAILPQQ